MPDLEASPIRGFAIVLLGSFNPPIFQPGWFAHFDLIEDDLAQTAESVHIDTDYCYWVTREFGCEVTRDRLRLFSTPLTERREPLGDAAAGAFGLLYHTPVGAISMISFKHVESSTAAWPDFASELCTGGVWNDVMTGASLERIVVRREIAGSPECVQALAAEPSRRLADGVYLSVTHQYKLPDEAAGDAAVAGQLLREQWIASIDDGDDLIESLTVAG